MQIEAAYDVLFMQSMKKRISGELEVSSSVRYADVPTRRRSSSVSQALPLQNAPALSYTRVLQQPLCVVLHTAARFFSACTLLTERACSTVHLMSQVGCSRWTVPAVMAVFCWHPQQYCQHTATVLPLYCQRTASTCSKQPACALSAMQRSSNTQPSLLQKLPGGGISVEAPKQNIAAGQAAVFAGLGTWAILQVGYAGWAFVGGRV